MRFLHFWLGCVLSGVPLSAAQNTQELRSLTLREALQIALNANPRSLAAQSSIERAEGEMESARGRLLPEIGISARITRIDQPIVLDLDPIRSAMIGLHSTNADGSVNEAMAQYLNASLPHFQSEVQSELYYNATASVVWPIFTGGRLWAGYQAAKANVDARKADQSNANSEVLMEVCQRYFSLRLAQELVQLREKTLVTLSSHTDNARRLESGGQIASAERLRAEVALAEAERELSDARRDLSLARLALANTLGSDTLISPATALQGVVTSSSLQEFQARADQNHPGLRRLRVEQERAQLNLNASRGEWFPVVSLFGKREIYTKDLTLFEPEWAVGAQLQWSLFSGGQTLGKQHSAKALQRELQWHANQAHDNVRLLVEKRWRELEHASDRLQSLAKTTELANESLRAQQRAFEAGVATSLDVVDAQLALARVGMAELKARFDMDLAMAGLLETTGNILAIADMLEDTH